MSKLITTRYEYVCYDDAANGANLTATPPVYPAVLDSYQTNAGVSARDSYGTQTVAGSGLVTFQTAPGARITVMAATTNTSYVNVVAGAGPSRWLVGPSGLLTLPSAWNTTGVLTAQGCDATFALNSTAFSLQVMWNA